ncbi:uncharacterized protein LOC107408165 isoform X1 [Ziziphus jujuba]|uniref:Uncharacterized protein LOC107408165 isoform X1 n=2 Tax=Ziziphus jujuba TaxID=326968 RepID=A0ABM3IPF0_ZIZJJ|nr:uncharacterized protein LOC107408165 isoform X1 [Ziziphus jujuba]KAH7522267.1 hypothetical protein FEM48_Zijuj07G0120300 [Ziziphus jujuba var. spinosa]
MAGTLPGVGVHSRRRTKPNREIITGENWFKPSVSEAVSSINLDETAHRARQRLEEKLGYSQPSSRHSKVAPAPIEGRSRNRKTHRILAWVQNHVGGYCSSSSESTAMNQTEKIALYA